ncbi:MAG: hypothetical protein ACAI25_17795 [Planctomycetota bacterium]
MARGDNKKQRPTTNPQTESGRAPKPIQPSARSLDEESGEDFVVRGSVVETPEGYKLRF